MGDQNKITRHIVFDQNNFVPLGATSSFFKGIAGFSEGAIFSGSGT